MTEFNFHAMHEDGAAEDIAKLRDYYESLSENDSYTLEEKMSKLDEFGKKLMKERFGSENEILFTENESAERDAKEALILQQFEKLRDNDSYTLEEKMAKMDEYRKNIMSSSFGTEE